MTGDPRVQQLLDDLFDSRATPEEVCISCPELLSEVRERWHQLRRVEAELAMLFPTALTPGERLPVVGESTLPQIPGYEVEAVLGRGGMGVVFRARHLRLNRVVALKMVLAGAYAGAHERERFHREAEAVAGLQHPNVVQIYDIGESDGRPYFTMEFLEGGNLARKIDGKPQPARHAATLLRTLARAVHAAHQTGIVHRDLKPANVLLTVPDGMSQPSWGIPKISDFGLARRLDSNDNFTRTGVALGTPSYMAPEQAEGRTEAVGTATDVYSLGAILYELLTGRPPFRAESEEKTRQQVITQEPVAPSRLNATVPRDLETICLKCLHKESHRRYASAAALAADLDCFLRGEAITARPERRWERLVRRARRNPMLSTAIVAGTLVALTVIGSGLWLVSERKTAKREVELKQAAIEHAAQGDLFDMAKKLKVSAWPEARAALERAKGRLGDRGPDELRRQLDQGANDLAMADKLDAIRLSPAIWSFHIEEPPISAQPDALYENAFREAGIGQVYDDPEIVAGRIRESNITSVLVAALDHWSSFAVELRRRSWVLDVARRADPDPTGWRDRARNPHLGDNQAAAIEVVKAAPVDTESVSLLLALRRHLGHTSPEVVPFLKRIQQAHPSDFWINMAVGDIVGMREEKPAESIRYYQAAVAIRPQLAIGHFNLGRALAYSNRREEAVEQLRQAVTINPHAITGQVLLTTTLIQLSRYDEAITQLQAAIHANPTTSRLRAYLGNRLVAHRRYDEAIAQYRQAVALEPKEMEYQNALRTTLLRLGRSEEVCAAWRKAIEATPLNHETYYGYAEYCLFIGKEDEYRSARKALLEQFKSAANPFVAERTGRTYLLLPSDGDELRQSVALIERAIAADPALYQESLPYFLFARGFAQYRQGKFDLAIAAMRGDASGVLGPAPRLVLAMALHKNGQAVEARKTLAAAVASHDWRVNQVKDQDGWIFHILRREAEAMILPNLQAFLDGKHQPKDNDERLAFLGACQFMNRTRALTQLYVDAFAVDPQLVEDFTAGHRYNAALAATELGCGRGTDATSLNEVERKRWREQARRWLLADLAVLKKSFDDPAGRDKLQRTLKLRQKISDFPALFYRTELDKLPADERKNWLALWRESDDMYKRILAGK